MYPLDLAASLAGFNHEDAGKTRGYVRCWVIMNKVFEEVSRNASSSYESSGNHLREESGSVKRYTALLRKSAVCTPQCCRTSTDKISIPAKTHDFITLIFLHTIHYIVGKILRKFKTKEDNHKCVGNGNMILWIWQGLDALTGVLQSAGMQPCLAGGGGWSLQARSWEQPLSRCTARCI